MPSAERQHSRIALGRVPRRSAPTKEHRSPTKSGSTSSLTCPTSRPRDGATTTRRVLGGILWVARTGSSWREMPEEFGKWETAYRRYELWLKQGLWQRILEALGEEALPGPAPK